MSIHQVQFSVDLRIHDARSVHAAALGKCRADGMSEEDILGFIGTAEDPDLCNCVVALVDPGYLPGCEIESSGAELVRVFP